MNTKHSIEIQEDYEPLIERENKYIMYVYHGGRGGGKSIGITDAIISLCLISKENAFCGREIKADNDKSIAETFAERLKYWSDVGAIDKRLYIIKRDSISFLNGSKITFTGFSEITIDGMKSTGATICWVDEAHSLTKRVIDLLLPSVRGKNSKGQKPISIFSFNRQLINDPIYVEAKSRTDCYLKQVNFEDNNFFYDNEALKLMATAYGWTRLEQETGLKRATLYNTLNNKSEPKIGTFQKILNALGFVSEIKLSNNQYKTI